MDFNLELSAFQGAIISADNVHQFSRLTSKGGNEERITFVIENIKRFLLMEKYIDDNGVVLDTKILNMRKFILYLILNTDLPVLQHMMDLTEIEPLIWSIPTVPKHLMCEMIWQLHLERFIYELIPCCWPQMGLEVAESFLENFKYFSPTECLHKLHRLSAACYALLCRLTYFKDNDNQNTHTEVFEVLQKYLKYYTNPPNMHRLDALNNDDLYKYKGKSLKSMLLLINECCNVFTQSINFTSDDAIYKLTYSDKCFQNIGFKVCDSPNTEVLDCLNNCNKFLLDVFQEIVMDISVDIFCAWSEFEEDGKSFQQTIGELCDKVQTKLQSISSVAEHPVVSMIELMARKPTNINDIINTIDTPTILEKVNNNNEESTLWIHGLVHKEQLCQDPELMDVIYKNVRDFDNGECFKLYNVFKDVTASDSYHIERLLYIRVELLNGCNIIDKHRILKEHFRDKKLFDTMRLVEDFDVKLTEIFNKLIADTDVDVAEILTGFYQNPKKVFIKIFDLARQNSHLIEPMLKLMIVLKDYTEYYYSSDAEPCMIKKMKYMLKHSIPVSQKKNTVKFICELKNNGIISSSQLLMLVIMPSMHSSLVVEDTKRLPIYIQVLMDAYTMDELLPYRAPLLVMMGQIMQTMRMRGLGSFQLIALQTVQIAINFQKSVINTYLDVIPDADGSWLRLKIQQLKLHPLNMYYFKSLWNTDNHCFFVSVTKQRLYGTARLNVLAIQLTQILPWCTIEEWCEIWDNFVDNDIRDQDTLRVFHSGVDVLTRTVDFNRTYNTLSCLFYLLRNLIHIIRYKFFKEPLLDYQVKACMSLLLRNLKSTNPIDVTEIEYIVAPLFVYLAERKNDHNVNIRKYFVNTNYYNLVNIIFPNDNMDVS